MSPSLPAPSKGALRALRQIALGTSCTVAFGAGLITEDRRRRIHSAREVSENARRIKTSRKYHSAGLSSAANFEEQVESYCQYGPWNDGNKQNTMTSNWSEKIPATIPIAELRETEASNLEPEYVEKEAQTLTSSTRPARLRPVLRMNPPRIRPIALPYRAKQNKSTNRPTVKENDIQWSLARDLTEMLKTVPEAEAIEIAVATFFNAFAEVPRATNISNVLMEACILLGQRCKQHDKLDAFIPVLNKMLARGPIDEKAFYNLQAVTAIDRLLEKSGFGPKASGARSIDNLKNAVFLFLAEFHERPTLLSRPMDDVGDRLLIATLTAKLYHLTDAIFWRLVRVRNESDISKGVQHVILANSGRGRNQEVLAQFTRFYVKTRLLDQNEFYAVTTAAVDAALELNRLDKAEEVLLLATGMARAHSLVTSTSWFLRVLGEHWRTRKNLSSTQVLFARLESLLDCSRHPVAMYSAIIQYCVEGGNDNEALQYIDRLKNSNGGVDLDMRTYGHLALAKAKRNDWVGVETVFMAMKSIAPASPAEYISTFVPILKLFATSHNTYEVEKFLYRYIEKLGVVPNQYMSNIIIEMYCKARELDCIPRWIQYVQSLGLRIEAITFNTILTSCWKDWSMDFDDLYRLCEKVKSIDRAIINSTTVEILQRAALIAIANQAPNVRAYHSTKLLNKAASLQNSSTPLNDRNFDIRMREALAQGNHSKALRLYNWALKNQIAVSPEIVARAVTASIQSTDGRDFDPAIDIINKARFLGINVSPSLSRLLLHQMEATVADSPNPLYVIKDTLATLEKRGMKITLPIISNLTYLLVDRGLCWQAIEIWKSLSAIYRISHDTLDLVSLTVLLRAYVRLSNCDGIQWVMSVLSRNKIIPDKRFKLVLVNGKRQARNLVNANPPNTLYKQTYDVLDRSLQLVNTQRSQLVLKRKAAEDITLQIMESAATNKASGSTTADLAQNPRMDLESKGYYGNEDIGSSGVDSSPIYSNEACSYEDGVDLLSGTKEPKLQRYGTGTGRRTVSMRYRFQ